ncbi:MAG: peptidylprolyl isomerase [Deltaproteobacteria bacterium]|nr:peptidylprolyl isomerase [Deltaproteobacteria bacterium]
MPLSIKYLMIVLLLAGLWGCGNAAPEPQKNEAGKTGDDLPNGLTAEQAAKVVAKVGDQTITVGDVTEQINRLSPYIKRRWATPEKRREFLQKLIQIELLSQEAMRNGLDNSPEVQRAVKQVMVRLMVKNDLENGLFPTTADEQLLKNAYEADWLKYHSPAQYRVSQIVVATEAEARQLLTDLQSAPAIRDRFRELAKTVSIDSDSRNRAGDIGYVTNPRDIAESKKNGGDHVYQQTPGVADAVAEAVWTLSKPNELYPSPVQTDVGYHVLMLSSVKPALNRSFNSVKRLLENQVLREIKRQKMDAFVASLRKKAKVKIYRENLDKVKLALSSTSDTDSADGALQLSTDETEETGTLSADTAGAPNSDNADN